MGFGAPVIGTLNIAYSNSCFTGMESVCDLGNQELGWSGHTFLLLDFPYSSFPPLDRRLNDDEKKLVGSMSTSDLYRKIGFSNYTSIDINGKDGALVFDLNYIIRDRYEFNREFDLVTNFGTSEHIYNQAAVWENIHNLCRTNGLMIGVLPMQGDINHGLYNYHPIFFEELAKANNYTIFGFYYTISNKFINTKFPFPFSVEMVKKVHSKINCNPSETIEQLCYVLKKNKNTEFRMPYQSKQIVNNKANLALGDNVQYQKLDYLPNNAPTPSLKNYLQHYSTTKYSHYYRLYRRFIESDRKIRLVSEKLVSWFEKRINFEEDRRNT